MTVLTWSDDRVEQLKKLWEAGLSASQIAAELGNVTRNAVIGKVHRLGLSGRAKSPSTAAPRQRKARPAQQMMRVSRPVSRGNTALAHAFEVEVEPDPIAYDNVVPMSQRLSLLELNEATCHWPVGDPSSPEFFFCGGKALTGLPYCAHHSRVAYQPAADRRRHQAEAADEVSLTKVVALRTPGPMATGVRGYASLGLQRISMIKISGDGSRLLCANAHKGRDDEGCSTFGGRFTPPSRTGRPARSRRRARCGSDPARGRD